MPVLIAHINTYFSGKIFHVRALISTLVKLYEVKKNRKKKARWTEFVGVEMGGGVFAMVVYNSKAACSTY